MPTQPSFEGSRRQFRGRIVHVLSNHDEISLDTLGHKIRVDYTSDGEHGREWLRDLLSDLEDDGYSIWQAVDLLVQVERAGEYEHSPILTADNTLTC